MNSTNDSDREGGLAAKLEDAFDWVYDGVSHDTDRPSFIKDPQAIKEVIAALEAAQPESKESVVAELRAKAAEKRLLEIELMLFAKAGDADKKNWGHESGISRFLRDIASEIHGVVNTIAPLTPQPAAKETTE